MYDIELNQDLLKLVENKRIALIGPAPYLAGKNEGGYIDDYDVIIRPNQFHIPEKLKKNYGSRTDIMFHNFATPHMAGIEDLIKTYPEDFSKLKMMGCLTIRSDRGQDILSLPNNYISDVVRNFDKINKYNIPFYWIGVPDYKKIYNELDSEPYTGILSIAILLKYPIKELFLSGYTFYLEANTPDELYFDGYQTERYKNKFMPGHGGDANRKSIEFFKKLVEEHKDIIKIDDKISNLLGIVK